MWAWFIWSSKGCVHFFGAVFVSGRKTFWHKYPLLMPVVSAKATFMAGSVLSMIQEIRVMKNDYRQWFRATVILYLFVWTQIWSTQHFFHQMFILPTYFFALQLWFTPFIPHCEKHLISMVYWLSFSDIHYKLSLINIWMHLYTPPPPFCSVFPLVCLIFCAPHTPSPPSPCNLLCYWVSVREDELALVFILTWALASHI